MIAAFTDESPLFLSFWYTKTNRVGPSGCGKSTIVGLLQRFYDPVDGQIFVDGTNIQALDIKAHRKRLGVVTQVRPPIAHLVDIAFFPFLCQRQLIIIYYNIFIQPGSNFVFWNDTRKYYLWN